MANNNNYQEIILYGLSNIQIKPAGSNQAYKNLYGAISVDISITIESATASNAKETFTLAKRTTANGVLQLLELELETRAELFGNQLVTNLDGTKYLIFNENDIPPTFSLRFTKEKANGRKQIYEFPNIQFIPHSISANTVNNGEIQEDTVSIDFNIFPTSEGIYYRIYE